MIIGKLLKGDRFASNVIAELKLVKEITKSIVYQSLILRNNKIIGQHSYL
ncbi:hypothetical protein [Dolichospermum sp. UHCC 0259]|nr:hypothetical protein [Dolichospermum sp. UHCC 0259]